MVKYRVYITDEALADGNLTIELYTDCFGLYECGLELGFRIYL